MCVCRGVAQRDWRVDMGIRVVECAGTVVNLSDWLSALLPDLVLGPRHGGGAEESNGGRGDLRRQPGEHIGVRRDPEVDIIYLTEQTTYMPGDQLQPQETTLSVGGYP